MDREVEERFTKTVQEVFDDEVEADAEEELCASERLERLTRVLTRHARAVVAARRAKDDDEVGGEERPAGGGEASEGAGGRGPPPKSKRERLRWKVAKWYRIRHEVKKWSGTMSDGYRRDWEGEGFWREPNLAQLWKALEAQPQLANRGTVSYTHLRAHET